MIRSKGKLFSSRGFYAPYHRIELANCCLKLAFTKNFHATTPSDKSITQFIDGLITSKPLQNQKKTLDTSEDNIHNDLNFQKSERKSTLDIQLKLMLEESQPISEIFKYVTKNLKYQLFDHSLLEVVVFNVIQSNNIAASTTLLHLIFASNPTFKLANEIWSMYTSQVCHTMNHLGATLVYHHLIDNSQQYSQENISLYNMDNPDIPFLVSPTILETLATIFERNNDTVRIKGLLSYFKRFYSYINHKKCYKTLKICLVESYSINQDLRSASAAFKDLCYSFRGHSNAKDWKKLQKLQKMSVFTNHTWRRNNIKSNENTYGAKYPSELKTETDLVQEKVARDMDFELYNPIMDRNIYTSPKSASMPLLNGSITTTDMPNYYQLILQEVKSTISSSDKDILSLISFITSNHFMISVFVIRSLCELGHFKEASSVLFKLPTLFRNVDRNALLKDENFINIVHSIGSTVDSNPSIFLQDILNDTMRFYNEQTTKKLSLKVYTDLVSTLIKLSNEEDLLFHLDRFINDKPPGVFLLLEDKEYEKLISLLGNNSKYTSVVKQSSTHRQSTPTTT